MQFAYSVLKYNGYSDLDILQLAREYLPEKIKLSDGKVRELQAMSSTYFYVDGSGKRVIFEQNTRVTDNFYAAFGSDADLRIFHDTNNSKIPVSYTHLTLPTNREV